MSSPRTRTGLRTRRTAIVAATVGGAAVLAVIAGFAVFAAHGSSPASASDEASLSGAAAQEVSRTAKLSANGDPSPNDVWVDGYRRTIKPLGSLTSDYDCNDANRITTPSGVRSAYPFGEMSLYGGWRNTSDPGVSATSWGATNAVGDITLTFTNWSVTKSRSSGISFRCTSLSPLGADITAFLTQAPADVTQTSVTLSAKTTAYQNWIQNPQPVFDSQYWVEYGTADGDYSMKSPIGMTPKETGGDLTVRTALTGLTPGTTYHYRFVLLPKIDTHTPKGIVVGGPDYTNIGSTFTTAPAAEQEVAITKNGATNAYLEVHGDSGSSFDDGAPVDAWRSDDADRLTTNEVWTWTPIDGQDSVMLVNKLSGKCLEVNGSNGNIDQWTCQPGSSNHRWKPVRNADGSVFLVTVQDGQGAHPAGTYYLSTASDPSQVADGEAITLLTTPDDRSTWTVAPH